MYGEARARHLAQLFANLGDTSPKRGEPWIVLLVTVRAIIPTLIACSCLSSTAFAQKVLPSPPTIQPSAVEHTQDFREIVVPITSVKIRPSLKVGMLGQIKPGLDIDVGFGTGFCLDAACSFIVTNYHVAVTTRAAKIERQEVVQRYFATGPHDKGATSNSIPGIGAFSYATQRDLAIFELRRSLPCHHGLTFSLDELESAKKSTSMVTLKELSIPSAN